MTTPYEAVTYRIDEAAKRRDAAIEEIRILSVVRTDMQVLENQQRQKSGWRKYFR